MMMRRRLLFVAPALLLGRPPPAMAQSASLACRFRLDGDQPVRHSVWTRLRWAEPQQDTENWDMAGWFDPAAPHALRVPVDGTYWVWVGPKFADDPRGRRAVGYAIGDDSIDVLVSVRADPTGTTSLSGGTAARLKAGMRISVWVEQTSGGTLDLAGHDAKDSGMGIFLIGGN